jgi:biopolymer transport protein TolR
MGMSVGSNRRAVMAEINVTPLVDVMLVLLIIFMVTAPMMQEGVSVDLPDAKGVPIEKEQKDEIMIAVSGKGDVFVNEVSVKESDLADYILSAVKDNPTREVYLRADKTVPYGTVVRIMAALRSAKIENINFITQAEESGPPK